MSLANWKDLAETFQGFAAVFAAVVGGLWVYWNFRLKRERFAKIQFDLDLRCFDTRSTSVLVEVIALIENKGQVRHWPRDFRFDLLILRQEAALVEGDQRINNQVLFEKIVRQRYWIPETWKSTFIDGGCSQAYRYITAIPRDSALALVVATFRYPDKQSEFHTAQKVFRVAVEDAPGKVASQLKAAAPGANLATAAALTGQQKGQESF